jgi:hypothetical protein
MDSEYIYDTHPDEMQRIEDCHTAYKQIAKSVVDILVRNGIRISLDDFEVIMEQVGEATHEHIRDDLAVMNYNGYEVINMGSVPDNHCDFIVGEHNRLLAEIAEAEKKAYKSPVEILKESFKPAGAK